MLYHPCGPTTKVTLFLLMCFSEAKVKCDSFFTIRSSAKRVLAGGFCSPIFSPQKVPLYIDFFGNYICLTRVTTSLCSTFISLRYPIRASN